MLADSGVRRAVSDSLLLIRSIGGSYRSTARLDGGWGGTRLQCPVWGLRPDQLDNERSRGSSSHTDTHARRYIL